MDVAAHSCGKVLLCIHIISMMIIVILICINSMIFVNFYGVFKQFRRSQRFMHEGFIVVVVLYASSM